MITVGLDFGTHQTKICIEDATNSIQKTYEFFEFLDNGKPTFFLPSIVQINEDGTLSFGSVNEKNVKKTTSGFNVDSIPNLQPPFLKELPEPVFTDLPQKPEKYSYPDKPKKKPYPEKPSTFSETNDWKSKLLALKNKMLNKENANVDEWRFECKKIDQNYSKILNSWQLKCNSIDKNYERLLEEWNAEITNIEKQNNDILKKFDIEKTRIQKEFDDSVREYNFRRNQLHYLDINEAGKVTQEKLVFHYFKFALYSNEINWLHQIDQETVSIWYLTNILFLLKEKLDSDFYIQMGIPIGINGSYQRQETKALCILIAAYELLEKYTSYGEFKNEKFETLLTKTKLNHEFSEELLNRFRLNVLPEAYAGLVSLTQKKKLEKGMNLLVDIGGGTTDIAFFTISNDNLPDIHSVYSIDKGLNSIYEAIASKEGVDIVQIQNLILKSNFDFDKYEDAISSYKKELRDSTRKIIGSIKNSFIKSSKKHNLDISQLNDALANRPVIYSGGGSTFSKIVAGIESFSDAKRINREMLSITTLKSQIMDENMFSILATSYGLSIPLENEIELTDVIELFNHIITSRDDDKTTEYNHGLTDY